MSKRTQIGTAPGGVSLPVSIVNGGTSGITAAAAKGNLGVHYTLDNEHGTMAPADSAVLFMPDGQGVVITVDDARIGFGIAIPGTVTAIVILLAVKTVLGSGEVVNYSLMKNGVATAAAWTAQLNATSQVLTITGLNVAVAVGDRLSIRMTCPVWVTNPTGVSHHFSIAVLQNA